ncbi:uncharacterized protein B0H64DRAFT_29208 [Chaetomium fimeti]|uniref:Uncharacterized protein n=1 Tax=Chaetomium fimeti TaxID=1854472 RepID=A0AAE0HQS2_9PEZI|nr:hypothetical protein B0H64DRAFT_29208 [Chaetomium fimeti]
MAPAVAHLFARDYENCTFDEEGYIDENSCYVPFWSTRTGTIVKWSLFLGIIVAAGLYLLVGYVHAQKRIKKGLPPLSYHRFLVSRATLARVDPRYRPVQPGAVYIPTAAERNYYDMQAMPPPVYDPNAPRPPMYEPPSGSTKIEPYQQQQGVQQSQQPTEQRFEYGPPPGSPPVPGPSQGTCAPPPGPPPSAVRP